MAAVLTAGLVAGKDPSAPLFIKRFTVAMDNSYPTGGELVDMDALVPGGVANVVAVLFGEGWLGWEPEYDRTNEKILVRVNAGADTPSAEEGDTTDLSSVIAGEMIILHI